jgi:hypothetical protein
MNSFFWLDFDILGSHRLKPGNLLLKLGYLGDQALEPFDLHLHAYSNQKPKRNQHENNGTDAAEYIPVIENGVEESRHSQKEQNGTPSQHGSSLAELVLNIMSTGGNLS